ncbi:RodZ domain-containing protein [Pseudomonas asiatica]|uniref:RodZ family helix-turn-helix domain-containing protein n=1 Tax=Pseudomonas asiatica TaxID=2219225 RepID=A0ABU5KU52_9PSED|nr:RodZ family helix-turn-helix domain-containing protein [Pseudomonas asiatica]MBA6111024.1 helix-turn-helix domain-containing protein [Pseudomonas asiatica]MDZ5737441.1 RodZ family helix-turn-helix domain-containing protein [Pseudomonas asiatica]MDZ5743072.1 RodZ family helix-turn-helix domain-containing protein [Pseudomonas asiatica]MDZ5747554.1 RodZ family helix-turn-helix domain-containing protein [Pseudomonas asiatica]MDZ5753578.1 RodZ family helix-turn-helix domain-containing protein [P
MKAAHPEVAVAPGQNPGELLRQARENRDWSQAEVARKLNLTVSSLNHVETGAFDKLPGHTFARGYIRAYAKLMDLDQAALVDAFDRYTGTHAKGSDVHSLGRIEEPVRLSHNILRGVSLLLLVAVVGGGFVWWQDQGSLRGKELAKIALEHVEVESADGTTQIHPLDEPEDQAVSAGQQPESAPLPLEQGAAEQPAAAVPAPASPAPADTAAVVPTPAQQAPVPAIASAPAAAPAPVAPVAPAPAAVAPATPVAAVAAAEPAAAAVPAGSAKVAIQFVADCWTQVTDGNGKVLFSAIKRKGDNLELTGKPPFSVRLGFARGAQVSYNGQAVDVAPFTSGETARLKLGQ